jgi:hypothetical protein
MRHVLLIVWASTVASEDPKLRKQGTAGKRKRVTLTIPQKLEVIRSVLVPPDNQEYLIIRHLCGLMGAELMEFCCNWIS